MGLWNTDKNNPVSINLSSYVNLGDQVGFSCPADVSLSTSGISKTQTSGNSFVGTTTVANATIRVTSAHSVARQCSLFVIK